MMNWPIFPIDIEQTSSSQCTIDSSGHYNIVLSSKTWLKCHAFYFSIFSGGKHDPKHTKIFKKKIQHILRKFLFGKNSWFYKILAKFKKKKISQNRKYWLVTPVKQVCSFFFSVFFCGLMQIRTEHPAINKQIRN